MGRDEEGASSNRAEYAAACIALEDATRYAESQRLRILLTDSRCLLMAIQKWMGEEIDPPIKASWDGDILQEILKPLWKRIELGLCTLFVKIKSHKGEFLTRWPIGGQTKIGTRKWQQDGRA